MKMRLSKEKWPEIERLAKTRAPEAIGVLIEIMLNKKEAGPTRVSAATAILDRGYGKPRARLDVSGTIDVNAAHLHAIKVMAEQVNAESRLLAKEGPAQHAITIVPIDITEPMKTRADVGKITKPQSLAYRANRESSEPCPDIFR